MEFEFALPLPINFSVGDNNFENSKQKYPRRIKLFVPLDSIDNFCNHLQAMKNNPDFHKEGKVFDMQEGTSHMVQGVNLWGNGKKNTFDQNEDDYGAYGTINPKMLEEAKQMAESSIKIEGQDGFEVSRREDKNVNFDANNYNMNWDSEEIPF